MIDREQREREYVSGERAWPVSPDEWAEAARAVMEPREFDYVAGGAGSESTIAANRSAFERIKLLPRMLVDNAVRSLEVEELLGRDLPVPLLLAPVGVQEMAHPEAELAVARAARTLGVPMVVSNQASTPLEAIAQELGPDVPKWFQLYWGTDPEVRASLVSRAEQAGYEAIVLTVDTFTQGYRERDVRNRFLPFVLGKGIAQYTSDPVFRSRLEVAPEDDPGAAGLKMISLFPSLGTTWEDIAELRELTRLPLLLKGILTQEDAEQARQRGYDGVIVSNHGGRQVDGAIASLDALPDVRVGFGEGPVLMDGGIRRGVDVLKAIALGADAVLLGRPYVYALAAGGQAGVQHFLASLIAEIDVALALTGGTSVAEYGPSFVAS